MNKHPIEPGLVRCRELVADREWRVDAAWEHWRELSEDESATTNDLRIAADSYHARVEELEAARSATHAIAAPRESTKFPKTHVDRANAIIQSERPQK